MPTRRIPELLKAAREAKGLSQRALGRKVGLPQSHISKIESGAVDLQVSSLVEIARALDLELALLPRSALPAMQALQRRHSPGAFRQASSADRVPRQIPAYRLDEDEEGDV